MATLANVFVEVRSSNKKVYIYSDGGKPVNFSACNKILQKLVETFGEKVTKTLTQDISGYATICCRYDVETEVLSKTLEKFENAFGVDVTIS